MITSPDKLEIVGKPQKAVRISRKIQVLIVILIGIIVLLLFYGLTLGQRKNLPQNKVSASNIKLEPASEIANSINQNIPDFPNPKAIENNESSSTEPEVLSRAPQSPTQAILTPEQELTKRIGEQRIQDNLKARNAPLNHNLFDKKYGYTSSDSSSNKVAESSKVFTPDNYSRLAEYQMAKDDHNKQIRKENFLHSAAAQNEDNYLKSLRKQPISPYQVTAGQLIPAVMDGGINSDLPGQIRALVRENVYDGKSGEHLLIPQGTKIIGTYDSQIAYGQERVLVVWHRLIFPDSSTIDLKGMAGTDVSGYSGLKDEVDHHYFRIFGNAMLMSLMSTGANISAQNSMSGNQPATQMAVAGIGSQLNQTGSRLINKNLNIQPTLKIRPGYKFNITATKDIVFTEAY
ncbi:Conjugation TrbI family protein [Candidatus Jidaibacter acanthamoeba]|uniref:Conjugation TrbI family protein n=1 Tax=Candidatus Jidaibacter acanthamoebae TaxID=86105 RepID=A0A0C1MZ31_9RICK|nr:TrbI/VirB10 family protein [Candidatus Jidaibacter acanthamoeba]KIE05256.1 Conjugation TrbI family protein [Candidatus Jidaibacter acanthamoeba]